MSKRIQSEPFQNATAVLELDDQWPIAWHEIALSFVKADGTPYTAAVTGSATMTATGFGADKAEAGANPLDLSTQRRWAPFMSGIKEITVTTTGMPADAYCIVTLLTSPV